MYWWGWGLGSLTSLIWPLLIIGVVWYVIRRKKNGTAQSNKHMLSISREDTISQWFLLLSVLFLLVTLLAINRDFGSIVSWRTILLTSVVVGFGVSYYFKAISTVLVSLVGLITWWGVQGWQWTDEMHIQELPILVGLLFIGLLLYIVGYLHRVGIRYERFSLVYLIFGIFITTGFLFLFSSQVGMQTLDSLSQGLPFFASWQIVVLLTAMVVGIVAMSGFLINKKILSLPEGIGVVALALFFGSILFVPQRQLFMPHYGFYYLSSYGGSNELSTLGIIWAVIFNIVVFLEVVGIIFAGYMKKETWMINLGSVFLFILIVIKYFDWFFSFLDKSIFFIMAGILLFAIGFGMEKGRRYVIKVVKKEGAV